MRANKTSGSAIITAVLIVALVTSLAVRISFYFQADIYRTEQMFLTSKMYNQLLEVTSWGLVQLYKEYKGKDADVSTIFKTMTINDMQVAGVIRDQQALFNINWLYDPMWCLQNKDSDPTQTLLNNVFEKLLQNSSTIHIDANKAKEIRESINDWFCLDTSQSNYVSDNVAVKYHKGSQPMLLESELLMVKGINKNIYQSIASVLTAYPVTMVTQNNILTKQQGTGYTKEVKLNASLMPPILIAAIAGSSVAEATEAFHSQGEGSTSTVPKSQNDIMQFIKNVQVRTPAEIQILNNILSTDAGKIQLIIADVTAGWRSLVLYTLVDIHKKPRILWQSYGVE